MIQEYGNLRYVRWWLPVTSELSPPLLLNRWTGSMRPYLGTADARAEWGVYREIQCATERDRQERIKLGMQRKLDFRQAGHFGIDDFRSILLLDQVTVGALTTLALSNNYVAGTSGNAIGVKYISAGAKTLDTVYYNIASYNGTAANVTDINLELRPESSTGAATPDTATLTESKTSNPSSATGWIAVTGWTTSIAATARYFVIVGDANGNGTDFATINSRTSSGLIVPTTSSPMARLPPFTTTGGFASGNTSSTSTSGFVVLKFSDGSVMGCPFQSSTANGSSTNQRGLRITSSGIPVSFKIWGIGWTTANNNISGMKIYTGTNGPSSGVDHTSTDILWGTSATKSGCMVSGGTPYQLTAGTAYSIVTTFSGATTAGPTRIDIGTGSDATLKLAMPGGGEWYWRAESGGAWSDVTDSFPGYAIILDGWVVPSGGSSGGIVIGG